MNIEKPASAVLEDPQQNEFDAMAQKCLREVGDKTSSPFKRAFYKKKFNKFIRKHLRSGRDL